jgi:predicted nucleic acid-binding Zn ribbon protein
MTRSNGKRRDPTTVGNLLQTSGRLKPKNDRIDRDRWRSLLGDRVGDRTRPASLRDGCLTIYVASAVWAQELTFLSPVILEKLVGDGFAVRELRFRIGDVGEPLAKQQTVARRTTPLKAELPEGLAERLAKVDDPALRAAIAEAAAYALGRPETVTAERRKPRDPQSGGSRSARQVPSPAQRSAAPRDTGGKRSR